MLRTRLPAFLPRTIFDVGANEGRVARELSAAFPDADIYAFEPIGATYAKLEEAVRFDTRIRAFNSALGRRSGHLRMRIKAASAANRVARWRDIFKRGERVRVHAGSEFCRDHDISEIDLLKIDMESHDLEVLRGFAPMLKEGRIGLIEAKVGMNPENRRDIPFETVKAFLEKPGYRLFFLYEQTPDTTFSGRVVLRCANAVFLSPQTIEKNRRTEGPER